tara:strand:+ start:62910 stop:63701 length:792 start_codon:yes stop_codon:yes gene_type:complete
MQVVILAGGLGSRLGNLTSEVPKPMVQIGKYPILLQIINHFYYFGFKEFIICLGYKQNVIKEYFINMNFYNNNISISGDKISIIDKSHSNLFPEAEFKLIDTGLNSMTGERLLRIKDVLNKDKPFFLTYGDGISDVNLTELLKFHKSHEGIGTVTSVHPNARFGEVISNKYGLVSSFKEKPAVENSWINGGYFIFEQEFFDYIDKDKNEMLEQRPLERLVEKNNLYTFKFNGYWKCMDTPRDLNAITEDVKSGKYFYSLENEN